MVNGVAEMSPGWLKHDFWVVDQLHSELILGIDWLSYLNPVIDWGKYEMTLPRWFCCGCRTCDYLSSGGVMHFERALIHSSG